MKKTTAQKAATYRLPEATTPENLEMKLMTERENEENGGYEDERNRD